jgi:hypothetical protein
MAYAMSTKASAGRVAARRAPISRKMVTIKAALELKPPPYKTDALEPHLSAKSFEFHWGKHHRAYVDNLNKQIAGTEWETKSLEEIVVGSWNNGAPTAAFNNAAQIWNHTFFVSLTIGEGGGGTRGDERVHAWLSGLHLHIQVGRPSPSHPGRPAGRAVRAHKFEAIILMKPTLPPAPPVGEHEGQRRRRAHRQAGRRHQARLWLH